MTHEQLRDAVRQSAGMLSGTERHDTYPRRRRPTLEDDQRAICTCSHARCDHKRSPIPLSFDVPVTYGACIMGCGCSTFTPEEGS